MNNEKCQCCGKEGTRQMNEVNQRGEIVPSIKYCESCYQAWKTLPSKTV